MIVDISNFFKDMHSTFSLRRRELQISNLRRTPKARQYKEAQQERHDDQHGQRNTNRRKHRTTGNA
jgi:hypothetical protein